MLPWLTLEYDMCFPPALKDPIFNVLQLQITPALLNVYSQLPPFFCIFHRKLHGFPKQYYQHDEIMFSEIQASPFHCPLGNSQLLSFTKNRKLDKMRQENVQLGSSRNGKANQIFFHCQCKIFESAVVLAPPSRSDKGTEQSISNTD